MKGAIFPRALPTSLRVQFIRFRRPAQAPGSMVALLKRPNRFPRDIMKTIYDDPFPKSFQTASAWYADHDSEDILHPGRTVESTEWSAEDVELWLEAEYPLHLPWSEGIVAILPDVEIAGALRGKQLPLLYAAVNEHAEMGFVDLESQKCWDTIPFDNEELDDFKCVAIEAGWNCEPFTAGEQRLSYANKPKNSGISVMQGTGIRIDDGQFDQITHSFHPGRRCGWCGSCSIRPSFIGKSQCMACHSKGDSIESRNTMNLTFDDDMV